MPQFTQRAPPFNPSSQDSPKQIYMGRGYLAYDLRASPPTYPSADADRTYCNVGHFPNQHPRGGGTRQHLNLEGGNLTSYLYKGAGAALSPRDPNMFGAQQSALSGQVHKTPKVGSLAHPTSLI